MFDALLSVVNRGREKQHKKDHIADRNYKNLDRIGSRWRDFSNKLRIITGRKADDSNERGQPDARESHRQMKFQVFRADQNRLRDEVNNPAVIVKA